MKITYLGFDLFYNCLKDALEQGHELVRLLSVETDNAHNFNANVISLARQVQAPVELKPVTQADIDTLDGQCDLIVVAGYPHKVPLSKTIPAINIHPSLLPVGKGAWPLPRIILDQHAETGVTLHKLSEQLDSGDILLQEAFPVSSTDTLEVLQARSQLLASKLLIQLLNDFQTHWSNAMHQAGPGSYWQLPTEADRTISWTAPVATTDRLIRAYGKAETLAVFSGRRWRVKEARVWQENHSYHCGQVVHVMKEEVVIAAVDGFVCLRFFQLDEGGERAS